MPTAVILYYATGDGPVQALLMPSAFVYSIFILLSTLGLDFFLCTFTGGVAAGEYALSRSSGVPTTRASSRPRCPPFRITSGRPSCCS